MLQLVGPAPAGETTKARQNEYDGLGRLTSVCEITGTSGSGTCTQTNSQTGFWTKYTYDLLGNIVGVTQNSQAASGSQQARTYAFDMIGRLTSETNPETGINAQTGVSVTYAYDALSNDSSCGTVTSAGDLLKKIDAIGNVTCYQYDGFHRIITVTYPTGTYASVTDQKRYVYDSATVNSVVMANTKGRLAEAYTCTGSCTTHKTDLGFSYTARGEVSDVWQQTPDSAGWHHVNATYWAHGRLNVLNGGTNPLPGLPAITYGASGAGLDGKGRITQVTAASGQNPVNSVIWNSGDQITAVTFGSLDGDNYQYDPNTGRMTQFKLNVGSWSQTGTLTWNANGTVKQLQMVDTLNSANNQTCTYGYDDLTRITSANCGTAWSQTFGFDPFGNLSKSGSAQFLPVYTGTAGAPGTTPTNQYYQITGGGTGTSNYYDSNGNLKSDITHTYTWDANGNMISVDGSTVTMMYDALDRMIEQTRGASHTEIVYGPHGMKLALMNGQTLVSAFVKLPGAGRVVYKSTGLTYYRHADHLGNSRLATKPTRLRYYQAAYAPYGEEYATAGDNPDLAFTDENQDTVGGGWSTNLYDFMFREYRTAHGRWTRPDPAGLAAVNPANPQSWNRYAYVNNSPVHLTDALGLCTLGGALPCLVSGPGVPHPNSPNGGDGGGGGSGVTCIMDGVETDCGMVESAVGSGAAVQCPNNFCSGFIKGQYYQFVAGAGGATGYATPAARFGLYEVNGTFMTGAQYNDYVTKTFARQIEAQREALARKIAANSGISYEQALADLSQSCAYVQGGNCNFQTSLTPNSVDCGGDSRCNGIHFPGQDASGNYYVHLDTSNPFSGPFDFFEHAFVDVFLGNVAYTIIPRPWP